MKINTNILSLQAQSALNRTSKAITRSLQRLSSGNRAQSAGDDASGMAIANRLESEMKGFLRVVRNINDSFGLLSTAEGAMSVQTDIVQRMRELALQSSSGTLSRNDRANLNAEFQALLDEFNRLTNDVEFNGVRLLDGSFGFRRLQVGTHQGDTIDLQIGSTLAHEIFQKDVNNGSFDLRNTAANLTSGSKALTTADFNRDGFADLASVSYNGKLNILLGKGDGTFETSSIDIGPEPLDVTVGDLNQDGKLDIVTVNSGELSGSPSVSVLFGNGDGTFNERITKSVGSGASSVQVGDLDGDGRLDIVTGNEGTNTVSILINSGNKTFQDQSTLTMGNAPIVSLADVNNDQILDLITSDADDETLSIRLGNGDGSFQARSTLSVGAGAYSIQTGDLNGDGRIDVVTADAFDGTLSILLGNADGTFQARTTVAASTNIQKISLIDLTGDGILDILGANGVDANVSLWTGTGSGGFRAAQNFESGNNVQAAVAADIDEDGVLDLITGDEGDATISYLKGRSKQASGISDLSIATEEAAKNVLSILSNAIANLTSKRSSLGAQSNRLQYAAEVSRIAHQNLSSARSNLIETDIASEMSELVRLQILQQSGIAVLAQTNISTRLALQLLQQTRF